ncbi:Uncharacterised protein [Streptococcus pneumoniae]|nr:Uncharacterised protein [Streptococcus pneumoniae]
MLKIQTNSSLVSFLYALQTTFVIVVLFLLILHVYEFVNHNNNKQVHEEQEQFCHSASFSLKHLGMFQQVHLNNHHHLDHHDNDNNYRRLLLQVIMPLTSIHAVRQNHLDQVMYCDHINYLNSR